MDHAGDGFDRHLLVVGCFVPFQTLPDALDKVVAVGGKTVDCEDRLVGTAVSGLS